MYPFLMERHHDGMPYNNRQQRGGGGAAPRQEGCPMSYYFVFILSETDFYGIDEDAAMERFGGR